MDQRLVSGFLQNARKLSALSDDDLKLGTIRLGNRILVDAEPGEMRPSGGRNYCRGGRGGINAPASEFELELA